ncbi:hypothetical protein QGN29_09835 [Temperatibacter marinus]|uniref:ACT domain-containing protein n=1 Tax=Temperatibacter marinus TaxID=1456591 RepID=A0AA52H9M7_9PROT|nr:hypothetical protein [Temperatibacter marinus]WND01850.1 hypothetical protein QGN29_09835 [Temperatibacter marinus]
MVYKSETRTTFSVHALHDSDTLARILDVFNVVGLTFIEMAATKSVDNFQKVILTFENLNSLERNGLVNKLNALVCVSLAQVETKFSPDYSSSSQALAA